MCGTATHAFAAKSQTLNVPSIPRAARMRPTSTPSAGKTRRRIPSDVPSAAYGGPASSRRSGQALAKDRTSSARQRPQASPGATPERSMRG